MFSTAWTVNCELFTLEIDKMKTKSNPEKKQLLMSDTDWTMSFAS